MTTNTMRRLHRTLVRRSKAELIDVLVELAVDDRAVSRQLAARFELQPPPRELVVMTRQAMADATAFDERDINRNFSYDHGAYHHVQQNLYRLIDLGQLPPAMELSQELMSKGSRQVEMSDEGLMADNIEACLEVVLKTLWKCDLPAAELSAWCAEMISKDCVGFICDEELRALSRRFGAPESP